MAAESWFSFAEAVSRWNGDRCKVRAVEESIGRAKLKFAGAAAAAARAVKMVAVRCHKNLQRAACGLRLRDQEPRFQFASPSR